MPEPVTKRYSRTLFSVSIIGIFLPGITSTPCRPRSFYHRQRTHWCPCRCHCTKQRLTEAGTCRGATRHLRLEANISLRNGNSASVLNKAKRRVLTFSQTRHRGCHRVHRRHFPSASLLPHSPVTRVAVLVADSESRYAFQQWYASSPALFYCLANNHVKPRRHQ